MELDFSTDIRKTLKYQILRKFVQGSRVVPSGRTDRKLDMTKLMAAFHSLVIAPKNGTGQTIGQSRRLWM